MLLERGQSLLFELGSISPNGIQKRVSFLGRKLVELAALFAEPNAHRFDFCRLGWGARRLHLREVTAGAVRGSRRYTWPMLTPLDWIVVVVYFVGVAVFGSLAGGRQKDTGDYFLGGRNIPWWANCGSVIATETSTLTVISTPGLAFGGSMVFLQLTFGYLIGRFAAAWFLLPKYFEGEVQTAYEFLGRRFGSQLRVTASLTFMVTRMLADGVRLFATAIPIKVILSASGIQMDYLTIIVILGAVMTLYTLVGGLKSVVWVDFAQLGIYLVGAFAAVAVLLSRVPGDWFSQAAAAGKTQIFNFAPGVPIWRLPAEPYWFGAALVGGAMVSFASHGTDHLIVQRLLSCKNLKEARWTLIGSGIGVIVQFWLFLTIGILLWVYYKGASLAQLGLARGDEVFPKFAMSDLPPGMAGLLLAAILAAALSSSLNALASSLLFDILARAGVRKMDDAKAVRLSRWLTLVWGVLFVACAAAFKDSKGLVIELALSIASFTYGGLLGSFFLGLFVKRARQPEALVAFAVAILTMTVLILGVWLGPNGWEFHFAPSAEVKKALELKPIDWPWFVVIGTVVTLIVGGLGSLTHPKNPPDAKAEARAHSV